MLTLLRHGRTEANASGLLQGRIDNELDATGHAQASAAAEALGPVDRVIASPLLRTCQTAGYLDLTGGRGVELDDRLIELDYGSFDGRPLSDISSTMWQQWMRDPTFVLPGGESLLSLRERVWACLEEVIESAADEHVVLVSHVSPIKASVQWALGVSDEISWRLSLATASVTTIGVRGGRPLLVSFNDTSHHT